MKAFVSALPVRIEGFGERSVKLYSEWKSDGFTLDIITEDESFSGEMSPGNICTMAQRFSITKEEYMIESQNCLSTNGGKSGFSYYLTNNHFVWKKLTEDENQEIVHGVVDVCPSNHAKTLSKALNVAMIQLNKSNLENAALKRKRDEESKSEESKSEETKETKERKKRVKESGTGDELLVLGLPMKNSTSAETLNESLKTYCEKFGEVEWVKVEVDENGRPTGFGRIKFVKFDSQEVALNKEHFMEGSQFCMERLDARYDFDASALIFKLRLQETLN